MIRAYIATLFRRSRKPVEAAVLFSISDDCQPNLFSAENLDDLLNA